MKEKKDKKPPNMKLRLTTLKTNSKLTCHNNAVASLKCCRKKKRQCKAQLKF